MWRPESYFLLDPKRGHTHKILALYTGPAGEKVLVRVTDVMHLRSYDGEDSDWHKRYESESRSTTRVFLNLLVLEGMPDGDLVDASDLASNLVPST